jgi:cell shape-determining protein MreD
VSTVISALMLLLMAAWQSTWPLWLKLQGQGPEITLAAVVCIGLVAGGPAGLVAGFIGAWLWASVSSAPMGNLFVSYMSLGLLAGSLRGRMYSDRITVAMIIVAVSVVMASVIRLVLAPPPSPQSWLVVVTIRSLYSAVMAIPIYLMVRAVRRYYPEADETYP